MNQNFTTSKIQILPGKFPQTIGSNRNGPRIDDITRPDCYAAIEKGVSKSGCTIDIGRIIERRSHVLLGQVRRILLVKVKPGVAIHLTIVGKIFRVIPAMVKRAFPTIQANVVGEVDTKSVSSIIQKIRRGNLDSGAGINVTQRGISIINRPHRTGK